jgi:hypothetical protein
VCVPPEGAGTPPPAAAFRRAGRSPAPGGAAVFGQKFCRLRQIRQSLTVIIYDRIYSSYHLPWYMNMRIDSLVFWFGLRKKLLYQTVLAYEFEYAWPWGPRVPGPRLSKDARSGSPVRGRAYARLVARDRRGVPYSYCYSHSRTPPTCDEIHTACCIHDTQGVCSPLQYTYRTGRIHTAHIRDSLSLTLCSHCVQCPHSARQAQPHTHENAWRRPQRPRHPSIALRSHDVKRLSNWRA